MMKLNCNDAEELKKHFGCKIEREGNKMKLTQPVLVQRLEDELNITQKIRCNLLLPVGKDFCLEENY